MKEKVARTMAGVCRVCVGRLIRVGIVKSQGPAAGWGWALWNFRGDFGVLDSRREDVDYEDYQGHKLDRELLELLRRY